ncbi:hypothetical protein G6F31_021953 [Rhizopus arrhizus]|nr:hypothetical protein G6F31_021953 [Rhizopus arrhizus]
MTFSQLGHRPFGSSLEDISSNSRWASTSAFGSGQVGEEVNLDLNIPASSGVMSPFSRWEEINCSRSRIHFGSKRLNCTKTADK